MLSARAKRHAGVIGPLAGLEAMRPSISVARYWPKIARTLELYRSAQGVPNGKAKQRASRRSFMIALSINWTYQKSVKAPFSRPTIPPTSQVPSGAGILRGPPRQAIPLQQFMGSPGQHSPDLPPLALHPGDHHAVVAGGLVAHPGDHGGFGPLLDRDAFRPGDRAAADRRGMIGDGRASRSARSAYGMKRQERHDRPGKSSTYSAWAFSRRRASASFRLAYPSVDRSASRSARMLSMVAPVPIRPWRRPSGPSSLDDPVIPGGFYPASQGSITRRKQNPAFRCGQNIAICGIGRCSGSGRGRNTVRVVHDLIPHDPTCWIVGTTLAHKAAVPVLFDIQLQLLDAGRLNHQGVLHGGIPRSGWSSSGVATRTDITVLSDPMN